jgi:sensor c-di-GMP phosphodiesterase-like protein
VAEGVEDEVALGMLIEYGCDSAQGYLFSRPSPAAALTEWLTESQVGAAPGHRRTVSTRSVSAARRPGA